MLLFTGCGMYSYSKQDLDNCKEIYNRLFNDSVNNNTYYNMENGECKIIYTTACKIATNYKCSYVVGVNLYDYEIIKNG